MPVKLRAGLSRLGIFLSAPLNDPVQMSSPAEEDEKQSNRESKQEASTTEGTRTGATIVAATT